MILVGIEKSEELRSGNIEDACSGDGFQALRADAVVMKPLAA